MKTFIEAIEKVTVDKVQDFKQVEITKLSTAAANAAITDLKKNGANYTYRKHICKHEEYKPCVVIDINAAITSEMTK
jgi:hypothetical protein